MNAKRRALILASLAAGNRIHRSWKGANCSGYLSHQLQDVNLLKELEVEELQREGLLVATSGRFMSFCSLELISTTELSRQHAEATKAVDAAREALAAAQAKADRIIRIMETVQALSGNATTAAITPQ